MFILTRLFLFLLLPSLDHIDPQMGWSILLKLHLHHPMYQFCWKWNLLWKILWQKWAKRTNDKWRRCKRNIIVSWSNLRKWNAKHSCAVRLQLPNSFQQFSAPAPPVSEVTPSPYSLPGALTPTSGLAQPSHVAALPHLGHSRSTRAYLPCSHSRIAWMNATCTLRRQMLVMLCKQPYSII